MSDPIEELIEAQGLEGNDAREIRAFARFLREAGPAPRQDGIVRVRAVDHWTLAYINGGPTPPLRWEGDDS